MSALNLPTTFESEPVAILFSEIGVHDLSNGGAGDLLSHEIHESLYYPIKELLNKQDGTFVSAVANTFIALFQTTQLAVQFSLRLQESLALLGAVALDTQRLEARSSVHYEQLYVEAVPSAGESLAERFGNALRETVFRKTEVQTARVGGKGLSIAARLLRRVPPSGIGLSNEAHAELGPDLAQSFRRIMAVPNSEPFEGKLTGSSQLPLWLYATNRGAGVELVETLAPPPGTGARTGLRTDIWERVRLPSAPIAATSPVLSIHDDTGRPGSFDSTRNDLVQVERLLEPIPGDAPSGPNLQYDEVFEQIKEARREDDGSLPAGVWITTPKKASRVLVEKLAFEALSEGSKDLRLVGWYLESLVYRAGFAALPSGLDLIRRMQVKFWATVHPALEEDGNIELRSAAIEGSLNLLEVAVTSVPLTHNGVSWLKYQEAKTADSRSSQELQESVNGTQKAFYSETKIVLEESLDTLIALDEFQRERFGDYYPHVGKLKSTLEAIWYEVDDILAQKRATEADTPASVSQEHSGLGAIGSDFVAATTRKVGLGDIGTFRFESSTPPAPIDCASEAIVVIDIVQATATSDLFGWYSVGRHSVRHLRQTVREIGSLYGLVCMKSTGDGLLLTYRDDKAADLAAVNAVQASLDLLKRLSDRNETASEERQIAIRLALHFGEVDVLPDDREGPNVSFAFRVEAINHASLDKALNPIDPALLPLRDYLLCSERIHDIVARRKPEWRKTSCGLFKLKGFTSWHELFLVSEKVSEKVSAQPRFDA